MDEDGKQILYEWEGGTIVVPPPKPGVSPQESHVGPISIKLGSVVAICGKSGSGKSFLLSLLLDLADQSGIPKAYRYLNDAVPRFQRRLVYVPQFPSVRRELTVHEECLQVWRSTLEGLDDEAQRELLGGSCDLETRFDDLCSALRMTPYKDRRISELSGGALKRFGLLLRLPFKTEVIVLDEPDTGLDSDTAQEIFRDLKEEPLLKQSQTALLLVTHSPRLTDWVREEHGQVVEVKASASAPQPASEQDNPERREPDAPTPKRVFTKQSFVALSSSFDHIVYRSLGETWHQMRVVFRSLQDCIVFVLAPILIFLLLKWSGDHTRPDVVHDSQVDDFAKYSFFGIVANAWLGLQLYAKTAVQDLQVLKEDFWWLAGLRGGRKGNLVPHTCSLTLGLFWTLLVTGALQSLIGAAIFLWQPFGWVSDNTVGLKTVMFIATWIPLFGATVYGGVAGLALGGVIAWWNLCVRKLRRRPHLAWVNLAVPLLMLFHIIFSAVYLKGARYAVLGDSWRHTFAWVNVYSALSHLCEQVYRYGSGTVMEFIANLHIESGERHIMPWEIWTVWFCWLAVFSAVTHFTFRAVLNSPDVRRE